MQHRLWLILCMLSLVNGCSRTNTDPSSDADLPAALAGFHYFQQLRVTDDFIVGVSSHRKDAENQSSEIFAYQKSSGSWTKAYSQEFPDSYEPRIEIRKDMTFKGEPLVLLHVHYGAAAESLEVFSIHQGTLHPVQSILEGAFEWSYDKSTSTVTLLGIPGSPTDATHSYYWGGDSFKSLTGKMHE